MICLNYGCLNWLIDLKKIHVHSRRILGKICDQFSLRIVFRASILHNNIITYFNPNIRPALTQNNI